VIEGRDPEGYPGPVGTLYDLASLHALAAEVKRVLFYLFARLRVEGDLPYRHPAVVADAGALVLILGIVIAEIVLAMVAVIAGILILGGWVRVGCARLLCAAHGASTS
jgi:hypothetical protein